MPKLYKFYSEKIILFQRTDTEDKPGKDGRLQEVFRAKLGLVPFKEGPAMEWYYYEWHRA